MDRLEQIKAGAGFDKTSNLWARIKQLASDTGEDWETLLEKGGEAIKNAFKKDGIEVNDRELSEVISAHRSEITGGDGVMREQDPQRRTEFSDPNDFTLGSGGSPGQSMARQDMKPEKPTVAARSITDTSPEFAPEPEKMTENEIMYSYQGEGSEPYEGFSRVQRSLYHIDGGKYRPKGENPDGDNIYGPNTQEAIKQFFADRGVETDGKSLSDEQVMQILEASIRKRTY